MTHFLRRTLFSAVLLASAMLARGGVSYDESPMFAFDTRMVDGLQGVAVSVNFTFDTRGATAPPRIPAVMT